MKLATKTLIVLVADIAIIVLLSYNKVFVPAILYTALASPLIAIVSTITYNVLVRYSKKMESIKTILEAGGPIQVPSRVIYAVAIGSGATMLSTIALYLLKMYAYVSKVLISGLVLTMIMGVVVVASPKLKADKRVSDEKDDIPYFLAVLAALSDSHLSFPEIIRVIARLKSLPMWSREMKFTLSLSSSFRVSIIRALRIIGKSHPDKELGDIISRLASVGESIGNLKDLLSRLTPIYIDRFFERLNKAYNAIAESLTLVMSMSLVVPTTLMVMGPLSGMSGNAIVMLTLLVALALGGGTGFLLYSMYPKILRFRASSVDKVVTTIGFITYFSTLMYMVRVSYPLFQSTLILSGISAVFAIYTALRKRTVTLYKKMITSVIDSIDEAYSMGENLAHRIRENSRVEKDKTVRKWLRRISESVSRPALLISLLEIAPNRLYGLFIEAFLNIVRYGAKIESFAKLAKEFEKIIGKLEIIMGKARVFAILSIVLAPAFGGITAIMLSTINMMASISRVQTSHFIGGGVFVPASFMSISINPASVAVLGYAMLLSVIAFSIAADIGRNGSLWLSIYSMPVTTLLYGLGYHLGAMLKLG